MSVKKSFEGNTLSFFSYFKSLIGKVKGVFQKKDSGIFYENSWNRYREVLQVKLKGDLRDFLSWNFIRHTMYHEAKKEEVQAVHQSELWQRFPVRPSSFEPSAGNLIHHYYSILQLESRGFQLDTANFIFEFGGGYGSLARIFYSIGFKGNYIIFDFPEFIVLQKFFLSSVLSKNDYAKVVFIDRVDDLKDFVGPFHLDLCVGLWSISEAPVSLRNELFSFLKADWYLFAYQAEFEKVINYDWFTNFGKGDKTLDIQEIEHLPKNYYAVGRQLGE